MNAIIKPLWELADFEEIKSSLAKEKICVSVSGCTDSPKVHILEGLSDGFKVKIIATFSDKRVKEIVEDLRLYERNVYSYPAKDLIFYQADIHGNRLMTERIRTLRRIADGLPLTIVTTFDALMNAQVPISVFTENILSVKKRGIVVESELAARLVEMGYTRNYQVEEPGQFSIRGGIIDVFDLTEENPYRMELWGDEVDSIRSFDILSQRSIENLESVSSYPATEITYNKIFIDDRVVGMRGKAQVTVKYTVDEEIEVPVEKEVDVPYETTEEYTEEVPVMQTVTNEDGTTSEVQVMETITNADGTTTEVPKMETVTKTRTVTKYEKKTVTVTEKQTQKGGAEAEKDIIINVGFIQRADYALSFIFVYDATGGSNSQELIDLLLRSGTYGHSGSAIKLE